MAEVQVIDMLKAARQKVKEAARELASAARRLGRVSNEVTTARIRCGPNGIPGALDVTGEHAID